MTKREMIFKTVWVSAWNGEQMLQTWKLHDVSFKAALIKVKGDVIANTSKALNIKGYTFQILYHYVLIQQFVEETVHFRVSNRRNHAWP